jgi:hypothetical protein
MDILPGVGPFISGLELPGLDWAVSVSRYPVPARVPLTSDCQVYHSLEALPPVETARWPRMSSDPARRLWIRGKAGYKIVGVWNGIASGAKQERPEPGVGAGPQGRRDPRHRTDQLGLLRP